MKKKVGLIIFLCVIFLGLVGAIVFQNIAVKERDQKINDLNAKYSSENIRYKQINKTKDSLMRINMFLAKYRILTEAMTYRDSIRTPMQYKIGDIVYLKRDSSRAVVSDIIVGGSKHEYYIKYKVLFKNNTTEDIIPELLY
jgi:predicted RNase H-like nuclease (RuvC/YqgF family)